MRFEAMFERDTGRWVAFDRLMREGGTYPISRAEVELSVRAFNVYHGELPIVTDAIRRAELAGGDV